MQADAPLRPDWLEAMTPWQGILIAVAVAVVGHLLVRLLRHGAESVLRSTGETHDEFVRRYPKAASIITIGVSSITFVVYFGAIGLILVNLGVNLGTYLATATVIGLAVGFGSQGLVQDIVVGLTLIFSDVLDVGDMVEVSGQTGRVFRIGLRFTTIVNFQQQEIYVPNRNIALIGRFRRGHLRAFVDVQVPHELPDARLEALATNVAKAMREQHGAAILTPPESLGFRTAGIVGEGGWRYLRLKFRIWPGQMPLIENTFRQRLLAAIRAEAGEYPDWMVAITMRAR